MSDGFSVRPEIVEKVATYILTQVVNNRLKRSISDIAVDLGLNKASVHRAIKALEAEEVIAVIPSEKAAEPNTIVYKGHASGDLAELMNEAKYLASIAPRFMNFFQKLELLQKAWWRDLQAYYDQQARLIDITRPPNNDEIEMLWLRRHKESKVEE